MEPFRRLEAQNNNTKARRRRKLLSQIPQMVLSPGDLQLGDSFSDLNNNLSMYSTCYNRPTFKTSHLKITDDNADGIRIAKWMTQDISILEMDFQSTLASRLGALFQEQSLNRNKKVFGPQNLHLNIENVILKLDDVPVDIKNYHLKFMFGNDGNILMKYHDITTHPCSKLVGLDELFSGPIIYLVDDIPMELLPCSIASVQAYSSLFCKCNLNTRQKLKLLKCEDVPCRIYDLSSNYFVRLSHKSHDVDILNTMIILESCRGKLYKLNMLEDESVSSLQNRIRKFNMDLRVDPYDFLLNPVLNIDERYGITSFQTFELPQFVINLTSRPNKYNTDTFPLLHDMSEKMEMDVPDVPIPEPVQYQSHDLQVPSCSSGSKDGDNYGLLANQASSSNAQANIDYEELLNVDVLMKSGSGVEISKFSFDKPQLDASKDRGIQEVSPKRKPTTATQKIRSCEKCVPYITLNDNSPLSKVYQFLDQTEDVSEDVPKKCGSTKEQRNDLKSNFQRENLMESVDEAKPSTSSSSAMDIVDLLANDAPSLDFEVPENIQSWIEYFVSMPLSDKDNALKHLINACDETQVSFIMNSIKPYFCRNFMSMLPKELALKVLSYLEPYDLMRSAQTCRLWKYLADDSILWKNKCKFLGITKISKNCRFYLPNGNLWKATFLNHKAMEQNWISGLFYSQKVLRAHEGRVITCMEVYRNYILSGSNDAMLAVWSLETGMCIIQLRGHKGVIWAIQMVDNLVISASSDKTVRVWKIPSGCCSRIFEGHKSTVGCFHIFQDQIVSGSRDTTLRLWSISEGRCLKVMHGHSAPVRCVRFNGRLIVSGSYDYSVKIWSPFTGLCLNTLQGHTNKVNQLEFDGIHIVSGSLDTTLCVWDANTGALKCTLQGHLRAMTSLNLQGNILVSGSADSTFKIWDISTGQCLYTADGPNKHFFLVTCILVMKNFIITSSEDGTVKLWNLRTGEFIRNVVSLGSGGYGGMVWRIRATEKYLVCAIGSYNNIEETKIIIIDFDFKEEIINIED